MPARDRAAADVAYVDRENEHGHLQICTVATCQEGTGEGRAWGHHPGSVARALADLTEACDCGARWHYDADADDEDDDG